MSSQQEHIVNQLLDAPSLSAILHTLYWNLPLDRGSREELGELRLMVNREEARRGKNE